LADPTASHCSCRDSETVRVSSRKHVRFIFPFHRREFEAPGFSRRLLAMSVSNAVTPDQRLGQLKISSHITVLVPLSPQENVS
jgi:hypothetical protein